MTPLRIGILGAARIAPAAVVQPARAIAGVEVVCVGARSLASAQNFAAAHGIRTANEGYAAVAGSGDVDLVYVALPTSLHAEWTIRAAEAGKHVLCEKSFAMDSAEAAAMVVAGQAAGVRIIKAFAIEDRMSARMTDAVSQVEQRSNAIARLEAAAGRGRVGE